MPRILIDGSPLLVRSAGVKTYLHHWIQALLRFDADSFGTLWGRPSDALDHGGGLLRHPMGLLRLAAWNGLPATFARRFAPCCDVLHVSNLLARAPAGPAISATVHDLTAWVVPEFHTAGQIAADREFGDRILVRAAGLIAVSEATRNDAIRILRVAPEKIRVIYPGVPESYRKPSEASAAVARSRYHLQAPYFLFTGTIEPRKNLDLLLDAWLSLRPADRGEANLVIAGAAGWKSSATTRRLLQLAREDSSIRYLGYVPEPLMPGLTAGALALVYPSRYEGFGFPVVQAMAAGCPVITSDISSLPEVSGGAALLVDPRSEQELAAAMSRLACSPSLRSRLATLGIQRAQLFTWERAAEQSQQYFSDVLAARR